MEGTGDGSDDVVGDGGVLFVGAIEVSFGWSQGWTGRYKGPGWELERDRKVAILRVRGHRKWDKAVCDFSTEGVL